MNRSYACDMAERYPESDVLVGAAESVWNGSDARINISIDVSSKLVNHMSDYLPEALLSVFTLSASTDLMKRDVGKLRLCLMISAVFPKF